LTERERLIREAWLRVREHFWRYPSGYNAYLHDPESVVPPMTQPVDQAVPSDLACEVITFVTKSNPRGEKWVECEGIVVERR
jgi:uncharacterized protein YyaL (SSP411 family)